MPYSFENKNNPICIFTGVLQGGSGRNKAGVGGGGGGGGGGGQTAERAAATARCRKAMQGRSHVWNFAFGANINPWKLQTKRGIVPVDARRGVLREWGLRFNHRGGFGNIVPRYIYMCIHSVVGNTVSWYIHVCMYVCVYVYMYIYIALFRILCRGIYIYVCMYVRVYVYMYVCIGTAPQSSRWFWEHCAEDIYICMCVCIYVFIYIYVYVYIVALRILCRSIYM